MKRTIIAAGATAAAALALAACGSSGDNSTSSATPAGGAKTVSTKSVDGVGNVLVDANGMALYAADQESGGKVLCDKGCTSFWRPLTAGAGSPTSNSDAVKLSVIKRPDGTMQVAANGKPLYTFAQDSPDSLKGNGFADQFGGRHFTWHAVLAGSKPASSSSGSGSRGGGGYGSGGGGSSNYGY
jgi:predicted lipoprotein with Yx(FWY)xxD motif